MNQSFFQEAARLNNEAVIALVSGDETTSINMLMNTVKMMKHYVSMPQQAAALVASSKEESSCFDSFSTVEVPIRMSDENMIFHQAIMMPLDEENSSPLDAYVYAAAVIFNLALAHHIQAGKNSNASNKAERLYATIMKLLDERVGHMRSALLLKLYCINNMAHIRFQNGEFDQVQDGLGELSTILKSTDECLLEGAEVQGMLMSVLLFRKPTAASAAWADKVRTTTLHIFEPTNNLSQVCKRAKDAIEFIPSRFSRLRTNDACLYPQDKHGAKPNLRNRTIPRKYVRILNTHSAHM